MFSVILGVRFGAVLNFSQTNFEKMGKNKKNIGTVM